MLKDSHNARAFRCLMLILSFILSPAVFAENSPKAYAVEASAQVQASPSRVTLTWPADPYATGYSISRKSLTDTSWGSSQSLSGGATSYTDSNVAAGAAYEYRIVKSTSRGYTGTGYVCAGINLGPKEYRGKVVLIVDNTFSVSLANELARLQRDLAGDGWIVLRHDVARDFPVSSVKAIIKSDYNSDPQNVKAVFLFGHVPVPYSGSFGPDAHGDHQGAWPADAYYGDMDGNWTDSSVSNTSAQRSRNWNVPGDGKFDQSELPSNVDLEVGRVDLSNMTCFSNKSPSRSETDLLRQYLNKDHRFRHGLLPLPRRGLVCDNFGERGGEAFAASGWRNFAPFFGASAVQEVSGGGFFSTLNSSGYLWSYGTGGGSFYTCNGVGSSDDFATSDIKTVFTMFLGSYFGDWDNESNFLRAPLGSSSYTLASAWAGRPHWFLHHMALGETIGYSTRLSQNNGNGGLYGGVNLGSRQAHVALMGDPTLRMHPVLPPSGLTMASLGSVATLAWAPSLDTGIAGYYVYRASSINGPFQRISGGNPVSGLQFVDTAGSASSVYMVRALKLEQSGSGTYYNLSQGVFAGNTGDGGGSAQPPPSAPSGLSATAPLATQVALSWADNSQNETGFRIERSARGSGFVEVATVGPNSRSYSDSGLESQVAYTYRVAAINSWGASDWSNTAVATTPAVIVTPAQAAFISSDISSQGNWKGRYGSQGHHLVAHSSALPAYAVISGNNAENWTWQDGTADARALQKVSSADRIAGCWFAADRLSFDLNLVDGKPHRVSIYLLDWDQSGRVEQVELVDAANGRTLDSRSVSSFAGGQYLTWDVSGQVGIRVTRASGANAAISAVFFDAASSVETVSAPVIAPTGGTFTQPVSISMSTATTGASIRYTTNGATPTASSALYAGPFTLEHSATVRAKAFKNGATESALSAGTFAIGVVPTAQGSARFLQRDDSTRGNWTDRYGRDGYVVVGGTQSYPAYAQVTGAGASFYSWDDATTDTRALRQSASGGRVAACWHAASGFTIDLNFTDGVPHRVAAYVLDWDLNGRSETVEVVDAASGAVLDSRAVSNFSNGAYLVWEVSGRVKLRFSKNAGNNALVMGLFFDPADGSGGVAGPRLNVAGSSQLASGQFRIQISGSAGQTYAIQASSNLKSWSTMQTITLTGPAFEYVDSQAQSQGVKFYRAVLVP